MKATQAISKAEPIGDARPEVTSARARVARIGDGSLEDHAGDCEWAVARMSCRRR